MNTAGRLFELIPCGDPFAKYSWDVREYQHSYDDKVCVFRGDLSPIRGRVRAEVILRRLYPGCKIKRSG